MKTKILLNRSGMGPEVTCRKGRHAIESIVSRFSLVSLICLCMLTVGVGNVWGADETVTWSVSTSTANTISKDSGTLPTGASASMSSDDSQSDKSQLTNGKKQTFTLTGMDGCTIKGVTINMKKSNKGSSATVKVDVGSTSLQSGQTITLSTTAGDKTVTLANATTVVGTGENVVITVTSNKNSAYVLKYKVTYEAGGGGGTPTCATPTFSPAAGSYIGTQSVTISSTTTGSTIYYTTNGTTPTTSSSHGTEGAASATVSVSSNMTLKAYAVKDGANDSEVATAAYTIVSCANDDFDWDLRTNSYTTGPDEEVTWSGTYATMHNEGTNATNYLGGDANSRTSSRFYSGNALTITPASGVTISHVVFTATTDGYASTLRGSTWTNAAASGSGSYVIVTPTDGTSAFSAAVGGTCGFTNVNVCYSACNTLGSINGSISLSQTETTMTVKDWSSVSNASSYTVKLYKWNSGTSSWGIVSGSKSGGGSGTQGTRTGVSDSERTGTGVTWSSIEYGATYKVTVQAIGNGSIFCDGLETAVSSVNSNDLTSNQIPWKYSIYMDDGTNSDSGWGHHWINSLTSNEGEVTINSLSASTTYKWKLTLGGVVWYSANATMTSANCTNWTLYSNVSQNCGMTTGLGGNYTYTVNTGSPQVSVTYPLPNQDAGNIVYWDASIHGGDWTKLIFRVGTSSNANAGSDCKVVGQLVPGTDQFYKVTTASFTGMDVWAIANNSGWTGSNTNGVYKTNTGDDYAVTKSSAYQNYIVDATGVTLVPAAAGSTGEQSHDINCTFYPVTKTDGMLTHTATIGAHTNGTINIAYTDVSGTAQNKTATTAGLAHRTILTITSTPNTGYHQTALTVDGNAFTSGSTHILSADATIAATYAINNYAVSKGTATGCSGDDFTLSADNVNHGGSITVTASPDASHKGSAIVTISPAENGSVDGTTISGITGAITVSVSFAAKETATIKTEIAGSESTISGTHYEGDSYTLPSTAADCPDVGLYGWYKGSSYYHATTAPSGANFYLPGATAELTAGENKFYAVYATIGAPANTYTKITTTGELTTGDYLIVYEGVSYNWTMKNAYQSSESTMSDESYALGTQITCTNAQAIWRITKSTNTITIYSENSSKYFGFTSNHVALMNASQDLSYEVSGGKWAIYAGSDYLDYGSYFQRGSSKVYKAALFKRDQTISGPYTTSPVCTTHELDVVADPVAGGTAEAEKTVLGETKTTTATATPNSHYTFSHWTISGTEATMSNTVDNKSTDNPVTVTMGTADATLTAHFTEKEKCTVVFKNNGGIESSDTYWLGENPVAPLLTDGVLNDACDATSDKHYGWTRNLITGNVADQATLDARTGSDVVYTKAATLPAITAGDDGTTITYHAVWAQATGSGSGNYELVEEDLGTEWAGDYLIAYSSTIFADGRVGGKDAAGSIGAQSTHVTPGDNLSANEKVVAASWGDTYYVTLEEISENSNTYVLKTQDDVYNYQSSNNNGLASTDNKATAANYPITVNFESSSDIELALGGGAAGAIFHYNTSSLGSGGDVFRYYKNGGQAAIYLYKKMGGTTYSTFLTTCCEYAVNLTGDVSDASDHCTSIAFSNATIETCSSDGTNRRVTVTVTPNAGYEGPTALGYSGDGTADKKSGPTDNGNGTYSYVYEFAQEDDGDGTFTATCTAKTYRITFDQTGATTTGTAYVDVVFNSALPAIPSLPEKTDYNFAGYYTAAEDGTQFVGSTGTWYTVSNWINSDKEWIKADNKTLYPHWTEKSLQNYRTHCPSFAVYNQDGTSAADIHLTSTKDVEIYASQAAGNLIRIIASGLDANGTHPKIGVEYYDANNGDALVTGTDRVFRLCSSSTYNVEDDLLDLGENTTEYDQKFSICYTPKDYNQSHHYKLKLILRNNNTEKDNVTIHLYGRSLPKEFVIAAKSGDTWYALPNTLAATESAQGAISPTAITVDNATTPTKAVNPIGTVIYGACNKYTNDNRSGLRFTSDGAHWIQTSSTASAYKMWLSNTGYTNAQDWYLKSTDLSAYEVFMDPIGSPDDKRRIELYNSSGVKMGYHNTGSGNARTGIGNIYLLPVEFPSITAHIMEWGTDHVVVDLRTPGSSTKVKTQISGGTIGDEQSLESVKKDEGVYRLAVTLSSSDALKDLKLYFYNISDVLQGVAEFTIPRIVSSTTTTGSFGTPFKKDAPFVDLVILNGATLTVSETTDGTKFTFRDLYVYGNAKMVVPSGTYIDFSNVYLRGGHLNSSWNYVYSHPQLVLNGMMGNTSNTINYDYLTNNAQFYSLALPYDVTLSTIVNPDFNNKQSWLIHAYDGALRASGSQVSGWYDVEEGSTTGSIAPLGPTDELAAGVGYTFFGAPQKVNSIRQKWSVNRFPMTLASGSAEGAKSGVSVTAHGMTESAGVYTLNDGVAPNDAGWNMLGNPFLADIGGTETYETAVKGTILSYHNVKTMDASGNWTGGWHWEENETNVRYVRIPNDLGTEYEQVRFKDATLRAFHHFFIQAGATGTFNFDLATRAQSMPQRIKRGKLLLPEEMDVDFRLSKGEASTKFGLTLCDDFSSDYVMNEDIAEDLSGEAMKAYTLILDQRVTYNGLPFTAAQQIIPVGFRAPNAGEYTFSYQEDENSENIEHIYLTDMRLGVVTDLKDNTYKFASEIGVVDNRFVLQIVFSSNVTTDVEETFEQENGRPLKFLYQGKIYILRNSILYDITGKRVREINK